MNTVEEFLKRSLEQIDSLGKEVFSKEEIKKMLTSILTSLNYRLIHNVKL